MNGAASLFGMRSHDKEEFSPREPASCPVQVAILCTAALLREGIAAAIRAEADLSIWAPGSEEPPDVVLWIAESGAGLGVLRQAPLLDPPRRAVLFDAAGRLGPATAGIHGFLGYLPPDVDAERLRLCLRHVAAGQPDAPEPYLLALVRALAAPPMEPSDREILRLLALGQSQQQIQDALSMSGRTVQRRISGLQARLHGSCSHHLGAIAVALGFGWPWEE